MSALLVELPPIAFDIVGACDKWALRELSRVNRDTNILVGRRTVRAKAAVESANADETEATWAYLLRDPWDSDHEPDYDLDLDGDD